MCSSPDIKWNPDIIINCPTLQGGTGNARQVVLNCLRETIAVGGSLVIPDIRRRNPEDINDFITNTIVSFDYLFDAAHFKSSLATYCPNLTVHDSLASLNQSDPGIRDNLSLNPTDLPGITSYPRVMMNPSQFRASFDDWLQRENKAKRTRVRVVLSQISMWSWPTWYDPPSFVRSLSSILLSPAPIRSLAASALYNLVSDQPRNTAVAVPSHAPPFALPFLGIHLRAEIDAEKHGFTNYTVQAEYFLSRLQSDLISDMLAAGAQTGASTEAVVPIYIASGDADQVVRFSGELTAALAQSHPSVTTRILTKTDLLPPATLADLTWDEQSLIDLLVMERAAYVLGVRDSTFSWVLALKRAAAANWVVGGFPTGPCWVPFDGEDDGQHGAEKEGTDEKEEVSRRSGTTGAGRRKGRMRGCEEDLAPNENWCDDLSALAAGEGKGVSENVDVLRMSIWP